MNNLNLYSDYKVRVDNKSILLNKADRKSNNVREGETLSVSCYGGQLALRVANSPNEKSYVSYSNLLAISKREKHEASLGCDPEFVFVDFLGRVCRANSFLPKFGKIGHDGALGELRPAPGPNEKIVVENLRELIRKLPGKISQKFPVPGVLQAEAHSEKNNCAIGFHIHIGAPKAVTSFIAPGTRTFIESFIATLDYFVGIPAMIPDENDTRRLGDGDYGKPGDWRVSRFNTIEYRTPGGFHLRSPVYAAGIMALALCAGENILSYIEKKSLGWARLNEANNFDLLRYRYSMPSKQTIRSVLNSPGKAAGIKFLPEIIKSLQAFESYEEYKNSIESYIRMVIDSPYVSARLVDNW